jgi:CelD/BcsL family acetyltransferase involved in cellulose biosynthesis
VLQEGRFYYWIPAYDPEFNVLSPGRLMLHFMLRECYDRGGREFDFLVGDEDYKWHYATHVRRVSPLGRPPLVLQVRRGAKRALRSVFALSPAGYALAQRLRRRLG